MATEIEPQEKSINPFPNGTAALDDRLNIGTVEIEKSRAVAEVQAALVIAQKCPRNKALAWERIREECCRQEFAHGATYAYPRGGQTVTGPSIRMAEALARNWGNIEFGLRELAQYEDETEVEAYAWDMETNVRSKQTFRSKHERHTKKGVVKMTDPRDIYEANANLGARRMRARILALLPSDVVTAALKECQATLAGRSDVPLQDRLKGVVKKFGKLGVTVKHIEDRLEHKLDEVLPEEYADLVSIYNSLNDKQSQPSDWFAVPKTATASEKAQAVDEDLMGEPAQEPTAEPVDGQLVSEDGDDYTPPFERE